LLNVFGDAAVRVVEREPNAAMVVPILDDTPLWLCAVVEAERTVGDADTDVSVGVGVDVDVGVGVDVGAGVGVGSGVVLGCAIAGSTDG
jgi:hypothetical protein